MPCPDVRSACGILLIVSSADALSSCDTLRAVGRPLGVMGEKQVENGTQESDKSEIANADTAVDHPDRYMVRYLRMRTAGSVEEYD
jgi:hypothetical protein